MLLGIPARESNGGRSGQVTARGREAPITLLPMKHLRIQKSLTSAENVVLTIVRRNPTATLLNCDEEVSIEIPCAEIDAHVDFDGKFWAPAVPCAIQGL